MPSGKIAKLVVSYHTFLGFSNVCTVYNTKGW